MLNRASHEIYKLCSLAKGISYARFTDYMIDTANESGNINAGVAIVKSVPFGNLNVLKEQNGLYTVLLQGKLNGAVSQERRVIKCVERVIDAYDDYNEYAALARLDSLRLVISNTTEAGIVFDETDRFDGSPPRSYPGKLAKFLYERFIFFNGDTSKGLIILPVELIEHNGVALKDCVCKLAAVWALPSTFTEWIENANIFCNTLVDRIVTGYPAAEAQNLWAKWGYEDKAITVGEPFALWVIESDQIEKVEAALPLDKSGLPVIFTRNLQPYRERKVRILNGAHTGTVLGAYLADLTTVAECMNDELIRRFMEKMIFNEIAPTTSLPKDDVEAFAHAVIERFENPFIRHEILSIALNSVSKWKTRILPSLLDSFKQTRQMPKLLTFSLAALLAFYRSSGCANDDARVLELFKQNGVKQSAEFVTVMLGNESLWGQNLNELAEFSSAVTYWFNIIETEGVRAAIAKVLSA